ncbi:MAG: PAS domain S-box protein [Desulfobacteraceae bacterium]|nr:MAG: PAS domain S-box protein [Desulfobacteraceae bacterium]
MDIDFIEESFFKRGNPLRKLLKISLELLGAEQTGILYGSNETKVRFMPTHMWDRGIMDRFDGRGLKGLALKLFGKTVIEAKKLSPVYFHRTNENGEKEETDGVIAHVLRTCADYYRKGISVFICPDIEKYIFGIEDGYIYIPFYSYDGNSIKSPLDKIKLDVRIVRHFKARNYISVYLPAYGILVANTADESLLEMDEHGFVNETELKKRLDILIKLVETSSLSYLGQLKGKRGAELLWRKESELRKTSNELVENERRFRDLYENAPVAYISIDKEGIISGCNSNASILSGYDKQELVGKSVAHLLSDKDAVLDMGARVKESLVNGTPISGMEVRVRRSSQKHIWVNLNIDVVKDRTGELTELRAVAIDITDKKNLENRLLQAQKMEAIGTLAGGIAHDFNNLLSPISGYTEMLLMDAKKNSDDERYLNVVLDCTRHAKELVNQMLMFSRQKEPEFKLVRVDILVQDILNLARSFLPSTIVIETDICSECGLVKADPVQIHQVVMNLITNAFHAMEEHSGTLGVSVDEMFLGEGETPRMLQPGSYVHIRVEDTGSGIAPQQLDNIFEPYYTTKTEGKGTGLGLSVVHGIIETHGGSIEVASTVGKGSRFDIFLPVCHSEGPKYEELPEDEGIEQGDERVLLVDDDEKVAVMEAQMLEKLGYQVRVYTHADTALDAFMDDPGAVDIVISDLTMPMMSGEQLALRIQQSSHPVPVILCTGFGEHVDRSKFEAAGIKAVLNKPVAVKTFAATLRSVLDNRS